ncbi:porin family protein [Aquimarina agarilytica]|uniref:hypothetical protein n=1 Tax=Aquimarina agarilytica TaxID=1087449 RepID=UPI000287AFFB|nr:hypothetical protein [Aquimarina agarilytica]
MIKKIIISVLLLVAGMAYAQESSSSPYSIHGLGLQNFRGSIANKSMGGLSLYSNPFTPNIQNPALYGDLKTTALGVGGTYSSTRFKEQGGESTGKATTLDYLTISIPAGKFGFGFGLLPYRSVGFSFKGVNNAGFEESNTGSGNVNRVYFGAGAKLYKGLKLGAEFQYNFGRLENVVTQFPDTQNDTRVTTQTDVGGFSYTFSGVYDLDLDEETLVRASVVYSKSGTIKSENIQQISAVATTTTGVVIASENEILDIADRSFSLPSRLTLGAGVIKKSKWFVGGEAYLENNNDYQDRVQNRDRVNYAKAYGVKVGGFIIPKYNSLTSYFKRMTYRVGMRYERIGLVLQGEDVNEFGTSFGVSLPVSQGYSSLDLGVELGSRGTTTAGLVKENFINFSVGLSLSDKWFRKRKFN